MSENLKKTALYEEHKKLGAKMVEFYGWQMPLAYKGILEEHKAVRERAGIFDVSHMGIIDIQGEHALEFVQILTVNDASVLKLFQSQYTMILDNDGKILDDMILTKYPNEYRFVVNCSNYNKILSWMIFQKKENGFKVQINPKENISILALQGPQSREILSAVAGEDFVMGNFFTRKSVLLGKDVYISHTGYTGEDGYEIFVENEEAVELWTALIAKGAMPIGLGARDTLRIEAGLPLYGHEIYEGITPYDLGYGWIVKFNKPKFNGKSFLEEHSQKRKLYGLILNEKVIPRPGTELNSYGLITSGTYSPTLKKGIALIISEKEVVRGEKISLTIRNKIYDAELTKLPFLQKGC